MTHPAFDCVTLLSGGPLKSLPGALRQVLSWTCKLWVFIWAFGVAVGTSFAQPSRNYDELRERMVQEEIIEAGITNQGVIESMRSTLRHEFVRPGDRKKAYWDMALPIGEQQTISPPFVVAYMTEQIDPQPADRVLEIGTGSGYQAAVLSPLVAEVYSIEIKEPLGKHAAEVLQKLNYTNVFTKVGDGYLGWAEHAPFDKIIVTCSPEKVPQPLVDQLKEGGRMIVPVGERYKQTLYLFIKENGELKSEALLPTLFVPMTGEAEDQRELLPDLAHPQVNNGEFEDLNDDDSAAMGWHYQRQVTFPTENGPPSGGHFARFENLEPGRGSQILQGFGIDGSKAQEIEVTLAVSAGNIQANLEGDWPGLVITFYDANRKTIAEEGIGPWKSNFGWRSDSKVIRVPRQAREGIIRVGLLGATGRLSVDDIRIRVTRSAD